MIKGGNKVGRRNYLIEGVSCSGKTSVATELNCRGYQAIHGDRVLAYQGDPQTGQPLEGSCHQHHIWDINKLRAYAEDQRQPVTFFCGGSRNFQQFLHLFDGVFVLDVSRETLCRRLDERPADEFGARAEERQLILRLHETEEDIPDGMRINANVPLHALVDDILSRVQADFQ